MVEDLMSTYGSRMVIAIVGVGLALLCLVGILWALRGRRPPSPFVRGGRNRQPRLQVLDAAAVDARRRLVLVRRDDVEHLIMIGGPTDVVIESRIVAAIASGQEGQDLPAAPSRAAPVRAVPERQTERLAETTRAPVARPEPQRAEPPRPEPVRRDPPRERPVQPATLQPAPAPVVAMEAPKAAPANPVVPAVTPVTEANAKRPAQGIVAQPILSPAAEYAANALDNERMRGAPPREIAVAPPITTPTQMEQIPAQQGLDSDFNRILEEEMAQRLANAGTAPPPVVNKELPPRPAAVAPITGATAEPSLQDEVARIFGEMSAQRDK